MNDHLYVALARDPETKDDLVFAVRAIDAAQARTRVLQFYHDQDWGVPLSVALTSFRRAGKVAVLMAGHAHIEYVQLETQLRALCEKLLEVADNAEQTVERDAIYAFAEQYEIGRTIIAEKFGDKE